MKIVRIEPTPSPNTMKVILDEELPRGERNNYKKETMDQAPEKIKAILAIEGVKGVYHVADFLAVERNPKHEWPAILAEIREIFGEAEAASGGKEPAPAEKFGAVQVFVQYFKGIPMQVKLIDAAEERRYGLPEIFAKAATEAQLPGDNIVLLRKWVEKGVRYGDFDEIGRTVVEELQAAYPEERLEELVKKAKGMETYRPKYIKLVPEMLDHPDWRERYRLLEQMAEPSLEDLPVLRKALADEKPSIRRLAVVYLGMIKDKAVLPYIYEALKDKNVAVRRTAGDCLSDLGYAEAQDAMIEALKDPSKLVRWRAAMFLYETGDERALPALQEAENDPEFEVALQVKMAIERIRGGQEGPGSVWKRMTEARKKT
ncbi:MAG: virulence factor [Caldibacillus debilis]|uniref:Virulence factor n=1 Tax=Caldibacillus debilis TaxID=301148 RepID=A0A3E0K4P7_9BACI|nr:conserved virulence factor C family protein [Caldibacillus debilis]OUM92288.1 MAG: virulence factor [Caldibacillus debilis]REJ28670.1 MAG: virulence factor [Caldibacillus debilis]REJ28716.1 MAG: virulence factor [Caldibacillus debilis]